MIRFHAGLRRFLRRGGRFLLDPNFRNSERGLRRTYRRVRDGSIPVLKRALNASGFRRGRALISHVGGFGVLPEIGFAKSLEAAGFEPAVLVGDSPWAVRYYGEMGYPILRWRDYVRPLDGAMRELAAQQVRDLAELMRFEFAGARVGRSTASTALRRFRVGEIQLAEPSMREEVLRMLERSMAAAIAGERLLSDLRPAACALVDRGYTPGAELFDQCLRMGVTPITWNAGHRRDSLVVKRYTVANRDSHPSSLSAPSWNRLRSMRWTPRHRERVREEIRSAYETGEWYGEVGTQFGARPVPADELRRKLNLDPHKKTAVIYPHIVWDGTFFWGTDLFRSYEEWLLETVRAATQNREVNWLIRIHPANTVKDRRDRVQGEPGELAAIRKHIGDLPPHVQVLTPSQGISTFSLHGISDYCLTVRGTVGIEAATFGVRVLTAGTGRYDGLGFTVDSRTRHAYLDRVRAIQTIPRPGRTQANLAERFAYGVFVLRTLPLKAFTFGFAQDEAASLSTEFRATTEEAFLASPDVQALGNWLASSQAEDLLLEDPIQPGRRVAEGDGTLIQTPAGRNGFALESRAGRARKEPSAAKSPGRTA